MKSRSLLFYYGLASQLWPTHAAIPGICSISQIAYGRLSSGLQQKLQTELSEGAHSYNAISAAWFADDLEKDEHLYEA